ncbi:MAG: DUF3047 domain-containing protein [Planctomycetota bacterium]|nr:DUF3047 domain-containing protein [Planctomycetota bacterium]
MKGVLFTILVTICISINCAAEQMIVIDDFENGLKLQWKSKKIKGETQYSVVKTENGHVLKAESSASASALIYKYKYDPRKYPILTWKWKVENIIKKGNEMKKEGDDCAARVYVIFPSWFPLLTKSINYIWATKLPKGKYTPSPYSSRSIMVAVESGSKIIGKWVTERRNVYEDFKLLFGKEPPPVGGVAIMTDTDNTGESAIAYYDDIRIETLN